MAEHQVGAAGLDDVEQPGGVALHRAHRRRRPRRPGAASEASASGLGSTTVTRWPSRRQRHREAAGAAADVEDVERVLTRAGGRGEVAQRVPDHGGAQRRGRCGRARRCWRLRAGYGPRLLRPADVDRLIGPVIRPSCRGWSATACAAAGRASRGRLARRGRGVVAGRLDVGVRRLAEPARVHEHPPGDAAVGRPAVPVDLAARPAGRPAALLARLVDRRRGCRSAAGS